MKVRLLVLSSAVLVAVALAAGRGLGAPWITWLLIVTAMGQGMLAGACLPRFWRGTPQEEAFGAGGRYLAFLAAVAFSAVEAHAVGAGLERGAPTAATGLLLLPIALAAAALRSATRLREEAEEIAEDGDPGPSDGPPARGAGYESTLDESTADAGAGDANSAEPRREGRGS